MFYIQRHWKIKWKIKFPLLFKIIAIIVILLLIAVSAFIFQKKRLSKQKEALALEEPQQQKEDKPIMVRVEQPKREDFEDTLPAMGSIKGYIELDLKFEINGVIKEFRFKNGEMVKKGDVIAMVDQSEFLVKLQYAKLQLEKHEKLYEIGAIAEAKLKEVKLEEKLARIELRKTKLKASFDGMVNNKKAEDGQFVTINDRIATFSTIEEVVAEVGIIERDIGKIKLGQRAVVRVDAAYPNIEFAGIVDNISSSFEGKSRTLNVRVKVPNQKQLLLPGMFARVVIYIYEEKNALVIPTIALNKQKGEYSVFTVGKDETAEEKKVKLAYLATEKAVIESGLTGDELLIVGADGKLEAGNKVKIQK